MLSKVLIIIILPVYGGASKTGTYSIAAIRLWFTAEHIYNVYHPNWPKSLQRYFHCFVNGDIGLWGRRKYLCIT